MVNVKEKNVNIEDIKVSGISPSSESLANSSVFLKQKKREENNTFTNKNSHMAGEIQGPGEV